MLRVVHLAFKKKTINFAEGWRKLWKLFFICSRVYFEQQILALLLVRFSSSSQLEQQGAARQVEGFCISYGYFAPFNGLITSNMALNRLVTWFFRLSLNPHPPLFLCIRYPCSIYLTPLSICTCVANQLMTNPLRNRWNLFVKSPYSHTFADWKISCHVK